MCEVPVSPWAEVFSQHPPLSLSLSFFLAHSLAVAADKSTAGRPSSWPDSL